MFLEVINLIVQRLDLVLKIVVKVYMLRLVFRFATPEVPLEDLVGGAFLQVGRLLIHQDLELAERKSGKLLILWRMAQPALLRHVV